MRKARVRVGWGALAERAAAVSAKPPYLRGRHRRRPMTAKHQQTSNIERRTSNFEHRRDKTLDFHRGYVASSDAVLLASVSEGFCMGGLIG